MSTCRWMNSVWYLAKAAFAQHHDEVEVCELHAVFVAIGIIFGDVILWRAIYILITRPNLSSLEWRNQNIVSKGEKLDVKNKIVPTKWESGLHLKFLPQFFIALLSIWWNWNIEIFPFLLTQQLKPTIHTDQGDGLRPRALRSDVQVYLIMVVLTIHRQLVSAAQRCQKTWTPWSHFCWSDPNPTPPLTNACLYLYLWGYYDNMKMQTDIVNIHIHINACTWLQIGLFFTHKLKFSSQVGLREHLMVLVFCLLSLFGSGINLSFTYGSDSPFGSMGTKLRASLTVN